jgi:flagellum-specific peptidoglycan hydrolase FlgJ
VIAILCMASLAVAIDAGPHTTQLPLALQVTDHPAARELAAVVPSDTERSQTGRPDPAQLLPDPSVRVRGLQVRRLAQARTLAATDLAAAQPAARSLWVHATRDDVRDAALELILSDARDQWTPGFRQDFLMDLLPSVLPAARRWNVPPSATLAQAILESGWGRSKLTTRYHNLFGVKAGASDQKVRMASREHLWGKLRPSRQTFRTYESTGESIAHHARLLGSDRRYAHARPLWSDWHAFLVAIAPRYASSPKYVARISEIVALYDLDKWDALAVAAAAADADVDARPWLARANAWGNDALADADADAE